MTVEKIDGQRTKLTADEGMILVNNGIKAKVVHLGANDSEDNWSEVEYDALQDVDISDQVAVTLHRSNKSVEELTEVIDTMLGLEDQEGE